MKTDENRWNGTINVILMSSLLSSGREVGNIDLRSRSDLTSLEVLFRFFCIGKCYNS